MRERKYNDLLDSVFSPDFRKKKTCFSHTYRPTHMAPETWASLKQDSVETLKKDRCVCIFNNYVGNVGAKTCLGRYQIFALQIGNKVCDGERPKFKKRKVGSDSPPYYYSLMTRCWKGKPESRPSFNEISKVTSNWVDAFTYDEDDQGASDEEKTA